MNLSVVVPFYNEAENIPEVIERLKAVCQSFSPYEIVCIDDGSNDGSFEALKCAKASTPELKIIKFMSNAGQADALHAGFKMAQGDLVVMIDGDLQNPPEAIPSLLESISDVDVVVGWRKQRHDRIIKKTGSLVANAVRRWLLDDHFHDSACGLKAFRRHTLAELPMHKHFHCFIPVLMQIRGYEVKEIPVPHCARRHGISKYKTFSLSAFPAFINLLIVLWMKKKKLTYSIEQTVD